MQMHAGVGVRQHDGSLGMVPAGASFFAFEDAKGMDRAVRTLSLMANGMRLEILYMLIEGDRSVSELVTGSGGSFSAVSQQLKLLTLGGLLDRRRDGRNIYYKLKDAGVSAILKLVEGLGEE
ncbi:MAG TPA: metalloregulator ArsR/SmtB family transcription factor [Rectinemataceae bacterium]|nr:metalloregulator ArsR/SmtB family transcription factor [Rectinemataceae bacterium]